MTRVGWIADNPGFVGGAELTEAEFRAAAPEGVEIVYVPADELRFTWEFDRAVVHNCVSYSAAIIEDLKGKPVARYHHDLSTVGDPQLRVWLDENATHIFCSPLQRQHYPVEGEWPMIPPALDLGPFRTVANQNHRSGAVCIGRMAYGKGLEILAEYPEPVDVYSSTPVPSEGNAHYRGATGDVAKTLSQYERFVFLPTALEPFGRAVVEAWAAGLELVVNRNVGALHWIENDPEALSTAAENFWEVVLA